MKNKIFLMLVFCCLLVPVGAKAHENYVLTQDQINSGMRDQSIHVLSALNNSANLELAVGIGMAIALVVIGYFFFQRSRRGLQLHSTLLTAEPFGHVILRMALAASCLASAYTFSYLGPEISVFSLPLGQLIHFLLYIIGVLFLFGFYTELAATVSLLIIFLATFVYKDYILTYANYFGEFVVLLFFGSRIFSVDKLISGAQSKLTTKRKDVEIAIIRITYGISILYPAIAIKLLHPAIIIAIVNQYNLTQFHWLFPHDPLLIALGSGLAQVTVGIMLVIGFETRLATFITFALMVMSVLFFQESVWPHYILLALAFYLIINNGGSLSVDGLLIKKKLPS